ncbi:MAG TPA: hypothetical protein VJH97_00300 [Candidatus Nanoarchaeia archaeon]|nr:hypothetical protein [Candidatus Nanoarchaeia archaeon]
MVEDKTKIKKKKWVDIIAPKAFNNASVGQVTVEESGTVVGRTVTANLMSLTGDFKRQNTEIILKITSLADGKAITEFQGYKVVPSSMRRLVRRGKEKIESTFSVVSLEGQTLIIKLFIITRFATKRSVLASLRKTTELALRREVAKCSLEKLIEELLSRNLQKTLSKEITKIYPCKILEIKELRVKGAAAPVKESI